MKKRFVVRIVDDELAVREALRLMLNIEGWQTRVYESAQDYLVYDNHREPGCVLLDVRMPEMSGLQLQRVMHERGIDVPIVFLTGHADIEVAIDALKRGALDFLLKPVDNDKLLAALEAAVRHEKKRLLGIEGIGQVREGLARLSAREREILQLFLQGLNDKTVAERLDLSVRTVQVHRSRIYEKFRVHTVKELEALAADIKALWSG